MNATFYSILIAFVLFSCSESKHNNNVESVPEIASVPESIDDTVVQQIQSTKQTKKMEVNYTLVDENIRAIVVKLDSIFGHTPYFTVLNSEKIFYICKGVFDYDPEKRFVRGGKKFGLADEQGNILLPPVYDKIYNPDMTAKGYIEVETDGKKGLYSYVDGTIIEPNYEVIFPSIGAEQVAIGKIANKYFTLKYDGKAKEIKDESLFPSYSSLIKNFKFDIKAKDNKYWYYTAKEFEEEPNHGLIITPSYINKLKIVSEFFDNIVMDSPYSHGIDEAEVSVIEQKSISDKIVAFITSFYESGVDGRGWQVERNNILTIDNNNNVISSENFLSVYEGMGFCTGVEGYRFVEDDLLEIIHVYSSSDNEYELYNEMTSYSYCKINADGKVERLEPPRFFDFTKYILLNENYLKGCFSKISLEDYEEDNREISDHLSIDDLDIMRNEIMAEYGYIFKSEKWKNYFQEKSWYTPKFDNVDHLLSDIEKKNIQFLIQMKEKMKGNEQKYTNKRKVFYSPAG